jgi:hypothetical protein
LQVGGQYRQGAGGAHQTLGLGVELERGRTHGERMAERRRCV